jgi:HEAT repeat protein
MKRITLTLMALLAATSVAGAQDPTPPARPVPAPAAPTAPTPRPARPTPEARPMYAPLPPIDRIMDEDAVRDMAREAARISVDNLDREAIRANADMARAAAEMARENVRINSEEIRRSAELAMRDMKFDYDFATPRIAPMPAMVPMTIEPHIAPMAIGRDFTDRTPPAPWAQGDPADSVYRIARDALGRGDYGRAARLFAEIPQKYQTSAYKNDAIYYEALARYKVGTTDELKQASKVLEPLVKPGTPAASSTTNVTGQGFVSFNRRGPSDSEVTALYVRINGALGQRGDAQASKRVDDIVKQGGNAPCDQEDIQVRTEALNALSQMDPAGALPSLRKVLDRKDECNASLRRNAVFILGRRNDAESSALLLSIAKTDPNSGVRSEAINFLARTPGDAGINALEEILKTEQDERIQRAAVRALMSSDNARARASMRALIDRKDAPLNLRIEAINSLNTDRATQEDVKYLKDLYARADNDAMKRAVIDAVGRMGGAETDQWILAIARNNNESSSIRATAMSRLYRSNISIADLNKLYDAADSRDIRVQIISILQGRKEPEAADKLVEIVKTGTDINLRKQAINALQRKNDPRSAQLFQDILDGKRP